MNSTAKVLQAAAQFELMAGFRHAAVPLFRRAVDIVLAYRQPLIPLAATWTLGLGGDSSQ